MKIKLALKDFTRNLQVAMRAIAARPTLPILNYLLVTAEDSKVTLTSYDMEMGMGIRVRFPAEVAEPGNAAVRGKTLSDIVSQLSAEDIELDFNDIQKVQLRGGRSEFTLVGKPGSEYPRLPEVGEEEEVLELPVDRFLVNLKRTTFACNVEMPKNFTSGVLVNLKQNVLQVVATDGRRLAVSSDELTGTRNESDRAVLIPAKTMQELSRVLAMGWGDTLELHLAENLALFRLKDVAEVEIITHLLDTPYPDYEKVIPEDSTGTLTVDRNRLIAALRQVGILARQHDGRDMAVLEAANDSLMISSKAESEGKAEVKVPVEIDGERLKVAFNYQYLLDPLLAVEEDNIALSYSGSLDPGVIKLPSDPSYTYVIMPVRLPD
jgi:DNA polymerase III subunit beta